MANKIFKSVFAIALSVVLFSACNNTPKKSEPIKIGIIVPLTGELGSYGKNIEDGAKLAVEALKKDSVDVELILADSKGETKEGISLLQKMINIDGCKYFIGDISSTVTLAMLPVIESNKVFLFSPGAATPKLTNSSKYFARNWPSNNEEANSAAEYAFNKMNHKNASIVYVNNDWGLGLQENFEKKFNSLGGKVLSSEIYEYENKDFKTIILKLKSTKPECIYLAGNQKEMGFFMKQFGEAKLNIPIISNTTFLEDDCLKAAGVFAEGVIIPTPAYKANDSTSQSIFTFYNAFKTKYGKEPSLVDANGYDAVMLIVKGIKEKGNDPTKVAEQIRNLKNYNGAGGLLNFVNGDVSVKNEFKKIINGKAIVIE
jgi:branched-chain amino acid transport system substrate-binding protein